MDDRIDLWDICGECETKCQDNIWEIYSEEKKNYKIKFDNIMMNFPEECLLLIFSCLELYELLNCRLINKKCNILIFNKIEIFCMNKRCGIVLKHFFDYIEELKLNLDPSHYIKYIKNPNVLKQSYLKLSFEISFSKFIEQKCNCYEYFKCKICNKIITSYMIKCHRCDIEYNDICKLCHKYSEECMLTSHMYYNFIFDGLEFEWIGQEIQIYDEKFKIMVPDESDCDDSDDSNWCDSD